MTSNDIRKHPKPSENIQTQSHPKTDQKATTHCWMLLCTEFAATPLRIHHLRWNHFRKLGIPGHSLSPASSVRDPLSRLIALVPVAHSQGIGHCGPRCVARAYLLSYVKRVGRPKALLAAAVAFPATCAVVFVAFATAESGTHPVSEFQR